MGNKGKMELVYKEIHDKVKIGLLTNAMPGFVKELTRRKKLPNMKFDAVVDSSVAGLIKPSPAIYELAEERVGHLGSEILFIDDSREFFHVVKKRTSTDINPMSTKMYVSDDAYWERC